MWAGNSKVCKFPHNSFLLKPATFRENFCRYLPIDQACSENHTNRSLWHDVCISVSGIMLSMRLKPHDTVGRYRFPVRILSLSDVFARFLLTLTILSGTAYPAEATRPVAGASSASEPAIVIGFVGGFVHSDDTRHAEVQLAEKLRSGYSGRAHVCIFENHRGEDAYNAVLKWLDSDGNGGISDSERRQARIILYGHSWGASAVIELARELQKQRIPVLLTIQVDSITKRGQDDRVIPANVKRAVNFYQAGGMLHGVPQIVPADLSRLRSWATIVSITRKSRRHAPIIPGSRVTSLKDILPLNATLMCGRA